MKVTSIFHSLTGNAARVLAIGSASLLAEEKRMNNVFKIVEKIRNLKKTLRPKLKSKKAAAMKKKIHILKKQINDDQFRFPDISSPPDVEESWKTQAQFVSPDCEICRNDPNFAAACAQTAPKKTRKWTKRLKILFTYTGDAKELNHATGVVQSCCYRCKVHGLWIWQTSRGNLHTWIPNPPWKNDAYQQDCKQTRTTKEAHENWKIYKKELSTGISNLQKKQESSLTKSQLTRLREAARRQADNQERAPIFKHIERRRFRVGEFHTARNLGERLYLRYFEVARLLDLFLTTNNFISDATETAWCSFSEKTKNISKSDQAYDVALRELFKIPGPYENILQKVMSVLGINWSKVGGGSLIGDQAYAVITHPIIAKIFSRKTIQTQEGNITLGSDYFVSLCSRYCDLRLKDLKTTCYPRNFCAHEIAYGYLACNSAMRLESPLFPAHVPPYSGHLRCHLYDDLKYGPSYYPIGSDRMTERAHQSTWRVEERCKTIGFSKRKRIEAMLKQFTNIHLAKKVKPIYTHQKKRRRNMVPNDIFAAKREKAIKAVDEVTELKIWISPKRIYANSKDSPKELSRPCNIHKN